MARWEEVFDKQLDLWKFWSSQAAEDFIRGFVEDRESKGYDGVTIVGERSAAIGLLRRTDDAILGADPVWVDPDMFTLVEHAAKKFEPEPLVPQDLFTERGFIWLPRPMFMTDIRGKRCAIRGVLWTPAFMRTHMTRDSNPDEGSADVERPGIALYLWSDLTDDDDDTREMPPDLRRKMAAVSGGAVLLHTTFMPFGMPYPDAGKPGGLWEVARIVQCLWRIASQTIAVRQPNRAAKPFRKRLEKAKFPVREVTVITLRRPKSQPSGEHRDVEWTHRWLVGGHWRNQPYPSLGIIRQIWISDYIKGPEDTPFLPRTVRAFEVVR